jgi:glycosyltransferase involved in cell wall biosynthesis
MEQNIENNVRIAVCLPVYNNAGMVGDVVNGVLKHVSLVVAVDDGSNDATHRALTAIPKITVIRFLHNRGKGAAIKAGIEQAAAMGATHVITIDGDGQHLPEDIPLFIEKIKSDPGALWVGNRIIPSGGATPPARSRFGRRFGNFWYRFNTGIRIHDTQCGFRVYPVKRIRHLDIKGNRYEYEQDALIKAAWNGISVKEVDIHIKYQDGISGVSHFRPVVDFLRIASVNSRAAFLRVVFPVLTFDVSGKTIRDKIQSVIKYELKAHAGPKQAAFSIAFGVFMGIFPIHGLQVALLMALSIPMKLNRPLAFLGVCVSSPPFLPFIIIAAVAIGKMLVPAMKASCSCHPVIKTILEGGLQFVIGSILLSVLAGIISYAVALPLFLRINKRRSVKQS